MKDFLTFQTFITPTLLILVYYIGAVFIPIFGWYFARWIKTVYFSDKHMKMNEVKDTHTNFGQRFIVYAIFLISFLCMELLWRVMFEFFIAYFDMHDALMKLS